MLNQHSSPELMMAIISSPERNESVPHDKTLQYLLILCSKVALNTIVLSFWRQSILKSLLGICSVSMYVVDILLVCAVSGVWLFNDHLPTSMCFILAHITAVYAMLPLPILIAGALDYAFYPNLDITHSSPLRAVSYWIVVASMWASALCYTYHYTASQPIEIYKDKLRVLVCPVHGSTVEFQFSMQITVAVSLVLLLYCKKLKAWVSRANELTDLRCAELHHYPHSLHREAKETGHVDVPEHPPPLFVSLTLGFAINWLPYLVMCLACALVGFVVPSYASVNLLWMACVNSALVGIAFWFRSDVIGPYSKFPDDTCLWNIYWHLSKEASPSAVTKPSTRLYIMVHKPMTFQEV